MADSKETIKQEIKAYYLKHGKGQYGWYIGIAENARERLFNGHNVDEKNGAWIYNQASSSEIAREIEEELIEELETKGGSRGGSDKTDYVYAYQITNETKD
jgi:hypothetical protein